MMQNKALPVQGLPCFREVVATHLHLKRCKMRHNLPPLLAQQCSTAGLSASSTANYVPAPHAAPRSLRLCSNSIHMLLKKYWTPVLTPTKLLPGVALRDGLSRNSNSNSSSSSSSSSSNAMQTSRKPQKGFILSHEAATQVTTPPAPPPMPAPHRGRPSRKQAVRISLQKCETNQKAPRPFISSMKLSYSWLTPAFFSTPPPPPPPPPPPLASDVAAAAAGLGAAGFKNVAPDGRGTDEDADIAAALTQQTTYANDAET